MARTRIVRANPSNKLCWLLHILLLLLLLLLLCRGTFRLDDCSADEDPPLRFTPELFFLFLLPP